MLDFLLKPKRKKNEESADLAHDRFFNALRQKEYARLDSNKQVYLDYTGGNLYATSQLQQHHQLLEDNIFGNPHSTNPTSMFATQLVAAARNAVLDFFNAQDYFCIFTPNASGALKIVGENYPFEENGTLLYFADNHNSVNGISNYCKNNGGSFDHIPLHVEDLTIQDDIALEKLQHNTCKNKLFAFPAQSNASGVKHDLGWIAKAKENGWDVLLDAAAFVPTSPLDLQTVQPDFVCVSFYKIFGYPTGIGCLLIHKNSFPKLHKRWFAGGTVKFVSIHEPSYILQDNHERFEDGTINYLDLPAIKIGLDYISQIGMQRIRERVQSLTQYLYEHLSTLSHSNGQKQLKIFGPKDRSNTGGTIIMSFFNPDGSRVNFESVEAMANKQNISLRSGCFCNPGLDEANHCITSSTLSEYFSSRNQESFDYNDMITFFKNIRGATRISVGIASNKADLDAFIGFVKSMQDKVVG